MRRLTPEDVRESTTSTGCSYEVLAHRLVHDRRVTKTAAQRAIASALSIGLVVMRGDVVHRLEPAPAGVR